MEFVCYPINYHNNPAYIIQSQNITEIKTDLFLRNLEPTL